MKQQLMSFETKHDDGSLGAYTQNYSSFGNLQHQSSFGEQIEIQKRVVIDPNRGSSNSTTRSQVSHRMAQQASKKVFEIVAGKPIAAESQSSLFDGSVRQNINFETYFQGDVNTLNNTQGQSQMQEGELAQSQKYIINTVTRSCARITKDENVGQTSRSNNSITETTKSVSKSGIKLATPAIGKTVASYRPEVSETNSNTGKRSKLSLSQRSRQSSLQNSQRNRSGSQKSRGGYNQTLKQLMKGNRQQPLVKAPIPLATAKSRSKNQNQADLSGFTESAEISNIDRYSSGESESEQFDQNMRLNERALEIQLLEKARLDLAQQAQVNSAKQEYIQRGVQQMLATKAQNFQARAFINQAFDSFQDQFYKEQVTPGRDLELSETVEDAENCENDMNIMNMPQQIHHVYNGKMEKITSRSNLYELSSVSRSKSRSKSPIPRRNSDLQSPTPYKDPQSSKKQQQSNSYKRVKQEPQHSNPIPLIHMLTPSSTSRLSSARLSRGTAKASMGTNLGAYSQRSELTKTNSETARDSALQRLDSLKQSARMYKTKAGGVQSSKKILVDMPKPKPNLPRSTNKTPGVKRAGWNATTVNSKHRTGVVRAASRQSSNGSRRNDGPVNQQSSRVFGSSLNYTREKQTLNMSEVENQLYKRIDTNKKERQNQQLYTFQQSSVRSLSKEQSVQEQQEIQYNNQMYIEDEGNEDKDAEFVKFLKSIQLYVQGQSNGESPRNQDGNYLYNNLQWLRESYKKFEDQKQGTARQNQNLIDIQKYLAGGKFDAKTRNELLNKDLVILDSIQHTGDAELRSAEYPALFTSKGDQSWADQTLKTQTHENTLFSDREHCIKSNHSNPSSPIAINRNPLQQIPEKQRKQIEFIDQIYSQIVLKTDERLEKKKTDKALKIQAQAQIRKIQNNYPLKSTNQTMSSHTQSQEPRQQNFAGKQFQKTIESDINRGQYSGYFQQPTPSQQMSSQGQYQMNQDLMSVAESLKAAEDLKQICQDLQDEKRQSFERRQKGLQTIQNNRTDDSVSFYPLSEVQGFQQPNRNLSQTLQSYDGKIVSPQAVDSLRQTISDEQNDLIAQVQMLQQRVGDPRNLSITQLSEALAALTTTANELKSACQGISEFTQVLGRTQRKKEEDQKRKLENLQQITFMEASSIESRPNDFNENRTDQQSNMYSQNAYTMTATPTQTDRQSTPNEPQMDVADQPSYVNSLVDFQCPALSRPVSHPSYINSVSEIQNDANMQGMQMNSSSILDHTLQGAQHQKTNQTQNSYLQTDPDKFIQISQGTHIHQNITATASLRNGGTHWAQQNKYGTAQRSASKNHVELLSQSVDSMDFTNSEMRVGNHQSNGKQDVKSYNSMNPAQMVQQNNISQSHSILSSPRYQIPPTVLSQAAFVQYNLQDRRASEGRRSNHTEQMNYRGGQQEPIRGKNTAMHSRIQSAYGVPGEIQYIDSSKGTSYIHSARRPSQVTHENNVDREIKSPGSRYDYLQSESESQVEQQKAQVKQNMAKAYTEYNHYFPQSYPQKHLRQQSNSLSPTRNIEPEKPVKNEQTLTPEEFAQLMAVQDNTDSFKLNSDSGYMILEEASAKHLYRNYNNLNSPPEMPSGSYRMINQPSTQRSHKLDPYNLQSESDLKSPGSPTNYKQQQSHYSTFTSQAGQAVREQLMNQYQR